MLFFDKARTKVFHKKESQGFKMLKFLKVSILHVMTNLHLNNVILH